MSMVPAWYLWAEARPDAGAPWAVHLVWAVALLAVGVLALFALSLLVLGWSRFTSCERAKLALFALLG
jgi:hypothetical protein